jgi:hypothetical protein
MAASSTTGVNGAWSMYRQCAATSSFHKSQLEMFTRTSLWLGILGAAIGTVAHYVSPSPTLITSKVLGVSAAVLVALAGLAATQAASGGRDKARIRCRAAAEALKSAVYLFSASVPPFDGQNRAVVLGERVEKTLKDLAGIELRPGKMDREPPGLLTVADYITQRVDDQIRYYTHSAEKLQRKADYWRYCLMAAAALGAALGAVSATFSLAPWVALLATLTASVTAYVKNQRYESVVGLYQATATRLQLLKDQWLDSGRGETDKADRDSFVRRCEETLALENGAWVAQWSEQPVQQPQQSEPGSASVDTSQSGPAGPARNVDVTDGNPH